MIYLILSTYAKLMEKYLASFFHQPEGLVEVGNIGAQGEEEPCKILISPPIHANLNIVIAAAFSDKRYKEGLSFLSQAITFMQTTSSFMVNGNKYTIEPLSPTLQDQSNIWTQLGGRFS